MQSRRWERWGLALANVACAATAVTWAVPSCPTVKFGFIPGVRAIGVIHTVLLHFRIEVAARGRKPWGLAFSGRVNVDCVDAGGQIEKSSLDLHSSRGLRQHGATHAFSRSVTQIRMRRHGAGLAERGRSKQKSRRNKQ